MKASARRALAAEIAKRRCPECRSRHLNRIGMGQPGAWCPDCGYVGSIDEFPYQNFFQPKEKS